MKLKILLITLIILSLPVFGITQNEQTNIKSEIEAVCKSFKKPCEVQYINSIIPQAYATYQGKIIITSELFNTLNYEEVRAVALHETGHHVLNHYKETDKFLSTWDLKQESLIRFRHKNELEADRFVIEYNKIINHNEHLDRALLHLVPPEKLNIQTTTHPSPQYRIDIINQNINHNYRNILKKES